jgi:hypothetical protein
MHNLILRDETAGPIDQDAKNAERARSDGQLSAIKIEQDAAPLVEAEFFKQS